MKSSFGIICFGFLAASCALAATTPKGLTSPTAAPLTTKDPDPTTAKPTPPHCTPGQRRAIKQSCKNYEECDGSFNWVPKNCSTFCKVFHPKTSKCVWNWQYPCLQPTTTTTTAPSTSTATSTISTTTKKPECTTKGTKKIYKKGDCKNYLECDAGQWVKKSCSFGYDFDVNKKDCVWSWWAKC